VSQLRECNVTPHIEQHTNGRSSRIDVRTTRHPGYEVSQRKRPLIEKAFSCIKGVATLRKTRHRGTERVGWLFTFAVSIYKLVRAGRLLSAAVRRGRFIAQRPSAAVLVATPP
jgi:hypothetical protein